jgi:DNA polymerase-1
VLLAGLRRRLAAIARNESGGLATTQAARLVFFQHDEVIVHCPAGMAGAVTEAVGSAAAEAGRLVFGPTPVRFPVTTSVVTTYADAK